MAGAIPQVRRPPGYRGDLHGTVTNPALTAITTNDIVDACTTILRTTDAYSPARRLPDR